MLTNLVLIDCKFHHGIFKQLHTFPEGKVAQDYQPIRRLKWGTASLIVRAPVTPIVLPIVHTGFEKVYGNICISEVPSFMCIVFCVEDGHFKSNGICRTLLKFEYIAHSSVCLLLHTVVYSL